MSETFQGAEKFHQVQIDTRPEQPLPWPLHEERDETPEGGIQCGGVRGWGLWEMGGSGGYKSNLLDVAEVHEKGV